MACILFYNEPNAMGRDFAFMDRLLNMHGLVPIVIDRTLEEDTHYGAHFYPSLTDAVGDPRWAEYEWIWLDHQGPMILNEMTPPTLSTVIYCVGSDVDGFGGEIHPGLRVRLPVEMAADQTYAALVIPILCGFQYWR